MFLEPIQKFIHSKLTIRILLISESLDSERIAKVIADANHFSRHARYEFHSINYSKLWRKASGKNFNTASQLSHSEKIRANFSRLDRIAENIINKAESKEESLINDILHEFCQIYPDIVIFGQFELGTIISIVKKLPKFLEGHEKKHFFEMLREHHKIFYIPFFNIKSVDTVRLFDNENTKLIVGTDGDFIQDLEKLFYFLLELDQNLEKETVCINS